MNVLITGAASGIGEDLAKTLAYLGYSVYACCHTDKELELKITLDESNYVLIEQETETNESEYSYVVVRNGKKVLSMSFELEDGIEEIVIKSKESGSTEIYKFYKSKGDIVIKHIKNGLEVKIVVKSYQDSNNETIYEYKVTETNKTYKYSK